MKWPFSKASQPDTTSHKVLFTPPRPPVNPVAYNLKKTQPLSSDPPAVTLENCQTISVPVSSIKDQLPAGLFPADILDELAQSTVEVPADKLLGQLSKGKVTLTVADLLALLPPQFTPASVANNVRHQTVVLPIDLIVAAIPSQAFATKGSAVVEEDDLDVPALFDEQFLAGDNGVAVATEETVPASQETDLPTRVVAGQDEVPDDEPIFYEKSEAGPGETQPIVFPGYAPGTAPVEAELPPEPAPVSQTVATAPPTALPPGVPATINIRVRTLVTNMPASVFVCPAPELWQHINPEMTVPLPVAPILPLLTTGRVSLPLTTVARALPANVLRSPLPPVENPTVALPLSEVIPQLPPSVFQPAGVVADDFAEEEIDGEVSAVFYEREAAPSLPEAPVTADTPPAPEVVAEPEEEEADIFVEQQPAPAIAPVVETTPEPVQEIAAETKPIFVEPPPLSAPEPLVEPAPEPVVEEPRRWTETAISVPAAGPVAAASETLPVELPAADVTPAAAAAPPPTADEPAALDERKFLINLNTCTLEDLTNIHGVGPALGARIIEYRNQHGAFTSMDQLREIPGIGRKTFRALAGPSRNLLNRALGVDHDRELTLQEIIHLTSTIPGIQGAILTSTDGLFLTGHLPPRLDENRLSVFAPQLFKKVGRYAKELSVGEVHRMTMFTDEQPVSIFQAGEIYLIVIHDTLHFSKALLRRLTRISEGIARFCRQRAVV